MREGLDHERVGEHGAPVLGILEHAGERCDALVIGRLHQRHDMPPLCGRYARHQVQPRDNVLRQPGSVVVDSSVPAGVVVVPQGVLQRERQPHIGFPVGPHPDEARWRDADYGHAHAVEDDDLSDGRVGGAKRALPESVADHSDRRHLIDPRIVGCQEPSARARHAESGEITPAHHLRLQKVDLRGGWKSDIESRAPGDRGERAMRTERLLKAFEPRIAEPNVSPRAAGGISGLFRAVLVERHQLFGAQAPAMA